MATESENLEAAELQEKPYDANDPVQVADARKKSGRKKKEKRENYTSLLETEKGRGFLWDFCACAVTGDPVVPGCVHSTYFNLGQDRKARELFKELLRVSPEFTAIMVKENMDK